MKLPIEKITLDFERRFRNRLKHYKVNPSIREAMEEDLESIVPVYNKAYKNLHPNILPINIDIVRDMYEDPEMVILVAKINNTLAGLINLEFEGPKDEYVTITDWAVDPNMRQKGVGTKLCLAAYDYFKQKGVKEIRCEVFIKNQVAYDFIKSLGFEESETIFY